MMKSLLDDNPYENKGPGKVTLTFPYNLQKVVETKAVGIIKYTYFINYSLVDIYKLLI